MVSIGPTMLTERGAWFPDRLLTRGPQRFRTRAEGRGLGLGLTIAVGQAGLLDVRIAFENHLDSGAQATFHVDAEPPRDGGETRRKRLLIRDAFEGALVCGPVLE